VGNNPFELFFFKGFFTLSLLLDDEKGRNAVSSRFRFFGGDPWAGEYVNIGLGRPDACEFAGESIREEKIEESYG
jgi:hypothetical protein